MDKLLTVDDYLEQRFDLTDDGRWHDLVSGKLVAREQPSDIQGIAILNLTRILGSYFMRTATVQTAYACFELGLVLRRDPDSVRFPPISVFKDGNRFEHLDEMTTDQLPRLAIDHARSPQANSEIAREYLRSGIASVWLIDSRSLALEVYEDRETVKFERHEQEFIPEAEWPGLRIRIAELFEEPGSGGK
ncbi:MAG: hypothetical protein CMJ46_00200 [Planctomyces sp.]|nr:hypothetical protein [Planctomyces sp.]